MDLQIILNHMRMTLGQCLWIFTGFILTLNHWLSVWQSINHHFRSVFRLINEKHLQLTVCRFICSWHEWVPTFVCVSLFVRLFIPFWHLLLLTSSRNRAHKESNDRKTTPIGKGKRELFSIELNWNGDCFGSFSLS